jgi:hypothetical protein
MHKAWASLSVAGAACFCLTVAYLQMVQYGYEPMHQLMSELALGAHGQWMFIAFAGLAIAMLALAVRMASFKGHSLPTSATVIAGLCFLGAGLFPLGATSEIHIALIALAFIATGFSMYVLPSCANASLVPTCRLYSWGCLIALVLCVVAGNALLPMGLSQRCAAGVLILWIVFSNKYVNQS